jgi:hypothetical protein
MTRRRPHLPPLALAGALLALGIAGVAGAGHYLGAAWDAPLQRMVRALGAALDLGSPSIILATVALVVSAPLLILARIRLAEPKPAALAAEAPGATDDREEGNGEDLTGDTDPVLPAGVDTFTTVLYFDLENQSITAEHVPLFARGISGTLWGISVDRRVYADSSQHAAAIAALRTYGFTVIDLPHGDQRQVVDKRMMLDVMARVQEGQDRGERLHIILITADTDFVPLVRLLRFFRCYVSVWVRSKNAHNESARIQFQKAGAVVRHFDKFLS